VLNLVHLKRKRKQNPLTKFRAPHCMPVCMLDSLASPLGSRRAAPAAAKLPSPRHGRRQRLLASLSSSQLWRLGKSRISAGP